ncbi:MAG: hypothetical protein ACUVQ8_08465 [Nitrososphaeria archaeon]
MSEYRKQVAVGALAAVLSALILAGGVSYLFPLQPTQKTSAFATHTTTATATSTATYTITGSTAISEPVMYATRTVPFDSNLKIESVQSVLSSNNVTLIAERLAYALDELPITAVAGYNFKTAKGSWINITLREKPFFELYYYGKEWKIPEDFTATVPFNFNHTAAVERAKRVMSVLGVQVDYVNLTQSTGYIYGNPSIIVWEQAPLVHAFKGLW